MNSGHDLSPVDNDRMLVSAHEGVMFFDLNTGEFTPFEPLKDVSDVKSVNLDPQTSRLLFTKGEIRWWTHNIYQQNPDKTVTIDSLNVYKIRPVR
jgi:hypothetical protein